MKARNFSELFNTAYQGDDNVVLLPRKLASDFNRLARKLERELRPKGGAPFNEALDAQKLRGLLPKLDGRDRRALGKILSDMKRVEQAGYLAELRLVSGNGGYGEDGVYAYHQDSGESIKGQLLCCYTGAVTEGIRNKDAVALGNGSYRAKKGAMPFRFKNGDIWRHANDQYEKPFLHHAPREGKGPRLVLAAAVMR